MDSSIGDKLRKAISNLSVVVEDTKKDYKKKIVDMDTKDRIRKEGGEVSTKFYQW